MPGEKRNISGIPEIDLVLNTLKRQAQKAESPALRTKTHTSAAYLGSPKAVPIDEKLRKQQIENDNVIRDQRLKEATLSKLFKFLSAETVIIFTFAFLQGFGWQSFYLEEWSFRILLSATILQITAMLTIAVQHLFPKKR